MNSALELAKYIVSKCSKDNVPISNLQLQKILYFVQKAFLQQGTSAFDNHFEAWQFGPVISEVYYHFSGYGAMPITNTYNYTLDYSPYEYCSISQIVENKRALNPWDMVNETHKLNGAWDTTLRTRGAFSNIPPELIASD